MIVGWIAQCRKGHFESREGQKEDAFHRRWSNGNTRYAKPAVEQNLRDQATKGMADDDGRPVQLPDDRLIVIDNLRHSQRCDWGRIAPEFVDVDIHARPALCDDTIPSAR